MGHWVHPLLHTLTQKNLQGRFEVRTMECDWSLGVSLPWSRAEPPKLLIPLRAEGHFERRI